MQCATTDQCWTLMTSFGYSAYSLTHEIFYLEIAEGFGCKKEIQRQILNHRQPNLRELQDIFCANILDEANMIAEKGFPSNQRDLFMEQAALCGMLGFRQFFNNDWLIHILSWQDAEEGCYKWDAWHPENAPETSHVSRRKREEKRIFKGNHRHHRKGKGTISRQPSTSPEGKRDNKQATIDITGRIKGTISRQHRHHRKGKGTISRQPSISPEGKRGNKQATIDITGREKGQLAGNHRHHRKGKGTISRQPSTSPEGKRDNKQATIDITGRIKGTISRQPSTSPEGKRDNKQATIDITGRIKGTISRQHRHHRKGKGTISRQPSISPEGKRDNKQATIDITGRIKGTISRQPSTSSKGKRGNKQATIV
ncbi:UPF0764 protein [Biomphalaria glabrata]